MPAQQQHTVWSAHLSGSTGPVPLGSCMIPDAAGRFYVIATAENREVAGRTTRVSGIAISEGDATNRSVELQTVGPCPPIITGLSSGAESDLRISEDGRLERATIGDGDIYAGKCDADGWAYLNFAGSPGGGGATPGGSVGQLQKHGPDGTLTGVAFPAGDEGDVYGSDGAGGFKNLGPSIVLPPGGVAGQMLVLAADGVSLEWADVPTGGPAPFELTDIAWQGLWLADSTTGYTRTSGPPAVGTFLGVASAGDSGGRNLTRTDDGFYEPPATGTPVNGHTPPHFQPASLPDRLNTSINASNFYSVSAYSGFALVYLDAIVTNNTDPYDNDSLMGADGSSFFGVTFRSSGLVIAYHYDGSTFAGPSTAISTSAWALVQWKFEVGNLKVRVNGGAWASMARGNVASLGIPIKFGVNPAGARTLSGIVPAIGLTDIALSDAEFDDVLDAIRDLYNLALA